MYEPVSVFWNKTESLQLFCRSSPLCLSYYSGWCLVPMFAIHIGFNEMWLRSLVLTGSAFLRADRYGIPT